MSESPRIKLTPLVHAISMNTSFVTTYPIVFPFPASENVMLFTLLKRNEHDVNKENLFALFQSSIRNIKKKMSEIEMIENGYCAAGLQEQNNTEEVYNEVNAAKFTFICKNVYETYSKTCAALGYIIKDFNPEDFLTIDSNYLWVNSNESGKKPLDSVTDSNQDKCYTIVTSNKNAQYMAIRDLGTIEPVKIDEVNSIYLLKSPTSPDCGRPIGIVIKKNQDGTIHTIHINCHMVNPSVLKPFTLTDGVYSTPSGIDGTKTILQLGGEYYPVHWIKYCIKRLENTINDMLSNDFKLNPDTITESISFVLTGDLNDPDGDLSNYLNDIGINVLGKPVKFYYDKNNSLLTACPNTNSSFVGKGADKDSRKNQAFNRSFAQLNTAFTDTESPDGKILWGNFLSADVNNDISNPANFAFQGDIATIGGVTGDIGALISNKEIVSNILPIEQTTDHLAVEIKVISKSSGGNLGGKSRKSRKSKKRKKSRKSRKSKKSRK